MSLSHNSNRIVTDGLISMLDPMNVNCTSGTGYSGSGYNPLSDRIGDLSYNNYGTPYLTNKDYFTCVGLTYPEGSQVAPWAGRQGISPGIDTTTGSKLYDHSRDFGVWAFDEDTNTWVPDSEFNGERINGHCYDTYDGEPNQHVVFQQDYDRIKTKYPNATFIFIGSHAAENVDSNAETRARVSEIGPISLILNVARPEFVMVGKPNKPNTWSYTRENINSAVAVLNVGLPLEGRQLSNFYMDGSSMIYANDHSSIDIAGDKTLSMWVKLSSGADCGIAVKGGSVAKGMGLAYGWSGGGFMALAWNSANAPAITKDAARDIGKWCYLTAIQRGTSRQIIVWDVQGMRTAYHVGGTHTWVNSAQLGIGGSGEGYATRIPSGSEIGPVKVYNKALTDGEVEQNFNAHRARYGI
jgi:hypothetical protein